MGLDVGNQTLEFVIGLADLVVERVRTNQLACGRTGVDESDEGIEPSRRVAALDYINSRFITPAAVMLPMFHDDDSDEDDRAPWPHELEPGGER